jgi:hypothetical protein
MRDESPEGFEAVPSDHLTRLQPADGVEFGMVEEMVASHWRLRRAWAIETRLLENEAEAQTSPDPLDRMTKAFSDLAATPSLGLLHRYQTRLSEHSGTDDRLLSSVNLSSVNLSSVTLSSVNERAICLPNPAEPDPDPEIP